MKASAIIKTVCWALIAVILTGVMVTVIAVRTAFRVWDWSWDDTIWSYLDDNRKADEQYHNYSTTANGSSEVDAAMIHHIEIEWIAGDITVKKGTGDKFKISESSNNELTDKTGLRYTVDGGTLKIHYTKYRNNNLTWLNNLSKSLTVEVPVDYLSELEIDTVSSDIKIYDLTLDKLEVNTVSAMLETGNVTAGTVDYATVSGDVNLDGRFTAIDGEGVSARLNITSSICPVSIDVESVSGNITLNIPENEGFQASRRRGSASINSDFETVMQNDSLIYKNGGADFNVDTLSGTVRINRLTEMPAV